MRTATDKQINTITDGGEPDWIRSHWRPTMAFVYMAVVIFDFIVGPIFWSLMQVFGGSVAVQWNPLTLMSGGVFHAAMGAVLGISAFSRGREKIEQMRRIYDGGPSDTQQP